MVDGDFDAGFPIYEAGSLVFELGLYLAQASVGVIQTFGSLLAVYALGRAMIGFVRALPSLVRSIPQVIRALNSGGVPKLLKALDIDYFRYSGSVSWDEAKTIANRFGFSFDYAASSRGSRFDNFANAVKIAKEDLRNGRVSGIMLAEEIQHGLDRQSREASRFARRNRNLNPYEQRARFHIEVFERILENAERGIFDFLTTQDLNGIRAIIKDLGG